MVKSSFLRVIIEKIAPPNKSDKSKSICQSFQNNRNGNFVSSIVAQISHSFSGSTKSKIARTRTGAYCKSPAHDSPIIVVQNDPLLNRIGVPVDVPTTIFTIWRIGEQDHHRGGSVFRKCVWRKIDLFAGICLDATRYFIPTKAPT